MSTSIICELSSSSQTMIWVAPAFLPVTRIRVGPMPLTSAMSGCPTDRRLYGRLVTSVVLLLTRIRTEPVFSSMPPVMSGPALVVAPAGAGGGGAAWARAMLPPDARHSDSAPAAESKAHVRLLRVVRPQIGRRIKMPRILVSLLANALWQI